MSQHKYPVRIRYFYDEKPDAQPLYAHGVFGGINAHGEVEMTFYVESSKLPEFTEQIVAPDGSFGHEMAPQDEQTKDVTRHVLSRVVMNYYSARDMLEWLEDMVQVLESEGDGNPFPFENDPEQ